MYSGGDDPQRVGLFDGLADARYGLRGGKLDVLVKDRHVGPFEELGVGPIPDDGRRLLGELAVERLLAQGSGDEQDVGKAGGVDHGNLLSGYGYRTFRP